jgi:phospholipase A1
LSAGRPDLRHCVGRAAALGVLFAATGAQAQATAPGLADCQGLADDSARLACYDRLAGRPATVPAAAQEPSAAPDAPAAAAAATSATPSPSEPGPRSVRSLLSGTWELDGADKRGTFKYAPYRPTLFLPLKWDRSVNQYPSSPTRAIAPRLPGYQHVEAELQLSMRTKLLQDAVVPGADLWLGYTQLSMWQIWNGAYSSPFRNTDYQPELIYVVPTPASWQQLPLGWQWRMSQVAVVHQSNGQPDPLSRSWNRVYGLIGLENRSVTATLRVEDRIGAQGGRNDDNPDVVHYLGRVETELTWAPGLSNTAIRWRPSLGGRGSVLLRWTYPLSSRRPDGPRWYLQAFEGFGETLLDYNFRQTGVGFGLTIFKL